MEVVRANPEVRKQVHSMQRAGETLGMVPTMGFLHAGHRHLIEAARAENDRVVVSIFVNPTQFGPTEDFAAYPRDFERDLALCRDAGADFVYAPDVEMLYPLGAGTEVVPPAALTDSLCGAYRPGHFTGVATVVSKLFALWQPTRAYFGRKDFQQTAVIKRLVVDLAFPVDLVLVPTVREPDGLAMSSRNVYLSEEDRQQALVIPQALQAGWDAARQPQASSSDVLAAVQATLAAMPAFIPQYVALVEPDSLAPVQTLGGPAVLAIAGHLGRTRLIDNISLDGPPVTGLASQSTQRVASLEGVQ